MQRSTWAPRFGWRTSLKKAGAFTPAQLTSLRAWFKSDVGITIATGVSQWNDQSGNANHLVQATGGAQPVVTAGAINGLPAITFDGVDDHMVAAFALAQPTTIFIVFSQPTWTVFDSVYDGAAVVNDMSLQQASASPGLAIRAGVAAVALNNNLPTATFGLVTAIYNGASSELQVNNTAATTGDPGANGGAGIRLGARGDGAGGFGNVSIAEVIVMAAVATAGERASMRAYSQARYGVGA